LVKDKIGRSRAQGSLITTIKGCCPISGMRDQHGYDASLYYMKIYKVISTVVVVNTQLNGI
jgi:hypothetical protein